MRSWTSQYGESITGPYDYRSVMHYSPPGGAFSIPPGIPFSRAGLSAGDIDGVARLYGRPPGTVTVSTNPPGLEVIVDGDRVTAPAAFDWLPGSVHTLEAPVLLGGSYVFGRWNDAGNRKRTVRVSGSTWFEANYIPLVRVQPWPPDPGTIALNPESPDGSYPHGSSVTVTPAGPSTRISIYDFSTENVYVTGMSAVTQLFGDQLIVGRNLSSPLFRIDSNVPRLRVSLSGLGDFWTPVAFNPPELPARSEVGTADHHPPSWRLHRHFQEASAGNGRYRFSGWSDGGEQIHEIEVPAEGGSLTLHVQREFALVSHASPGGEIVVSPASEDGFHPAGTQVQLTAVPEAGNYFLGWEHDLAGTETTRSLIMDRDRLAVARFSDIEPVLVRFGEPVSGSLTGRHFVRVPDGTSEVAIRFESSATVRDAEFVVGHGSGEFSTRLRESDTITITREALSGMRDNARLSPGSNGLHLRIRQYRGPRWNGKLRVSIQRDWIGGVWPPVFTFVSRAGWSGSLGQALRIAPVEGAIPQVRYRIVSDSHWLEASPAEWTGAQGEVEIAVTANGTALGAETYGGKLEIQILRDGDAAAGWTPTGIEVPVHFVVKPSVVPLEMEFVRIPAGTFVMGSPEDEEGRDTDETRHQVTLSQGFWMGKYEVTQSEWAAVMGSNPSGFKGCLRCPVESVSWDYVQEFLRRLNERESGSGYVYRLPTEAEWEYAARAGTSGARYGELDSIAWFHDNAGGTTHPVGEKEANPWGLHDMLGNVGEWTSDWYGEYPSVPVTDPAGPSTGSARVFRGGGWPRPAGLIRAAFRYIGGSGTRATFIGFRLVRTN